MSSLTVDLSCAAGTLLVPEDTRDMRPSTPGAPSSRDDPYGFGQLTSQSAKVVDFQESDGSDSLAASKAALLDAAASLEPLMKPNSSSTGGKKKASFLDKLKKSAKPQEEETPQDNTNAEIKPFQAKQDSSPEGKITISAPDSQIKAAPVETDGASLTSSPTMNKVASPSPFKTAGTKKKKAKIVIEVDTQEEIDALRQELEVLESQFAEETDEAQQSELEAEILRINIEIDNKIQEATMKAEEAAKVGEESTNPSTSEFDMELEQLAQDEAELLEAAEAVPDARVTSPDAPKKKGGKITADIRCSWCNDEPTEGQSQTSRLRDLTSLVHSSLKPVWSYSKTNPSKQSSSQQVQDVKKWISSDQDTLSRYILQHQADTMSSLASHPQ